MLRSSWMIIGFPLGFTSSVFLGAAYGSALLGAIIGIAVGAATGLGLAEVARRQP